MEFESLSICNSNLCPCGIGISAAMELESLLQQWNWNLCCSNGIQICCSNGIRISAAMEFESLLQWNWNLCCSNGIGISAAAMELESLLQQWKSNLLQQWNSNLCCSGIRISAAVVFESLLQWNSNLCCN